MFWSLKPSVSYRYLLQYCSNLRPLPKKRPVITDVRVLLGLLWTVSDGFRSHPPPRVCTGMPKWSHETPPDPRSLLYRGVLRPHTSCRARYFNGMNSQHFFFFRNQWKISSLLCLYGTHVSRMTQCYCDARFFVEFGLEIYRIKISPCKNWQAFRLCAIFTFNISISYLNLVINSWV